MKPTNDIETANRQCWDCLKRRLVCDFSLPHCKKCVKAGRQCSGYDKKKPLQWVESGQILSRKRCKAPSKERGSTMRVPPSKNVPGKESSSDENSDGATSLTKEYIELANTATIKDIDDDLMSLADRITIELVVSEHRHEEAQKIMKKAKTPEKAMESLEHVLRWMKQEDLPSYDLRDDTCEIVQAVHYSAEPSQSTGAQTSLTNVQ
jgi:hypothetical protein